MCLVPFLFQAAEFCICVLKSSYRVIPQTNFMADKRLIDKPISRLLLRCETQIQRIVVQEVSYTDLANNIAFFDDDLAIHHDRNLVNNDPKRGQACQDKKDRDPELHQNACPMEKINWKWPSCRGELVHASVFFWLVAQF